MVPLSLKSFALLGAICMSSIALIVHVVKKKQRPKFDTNSKFNESKSVCYEKLIGKTPLVQLNSLSKLLKCEIYVKMESMNPGGTGKDRAVKYMLNDAINDNKYPKDCIIVEGTSGSTGISLAAQCYALGRKLYVVMPDDQAEEKRQLLERLGATVIIVPCCAISNENHYVNQARKLAKDHHGIFINQFENKVNFRAHYEETGPEIWAQTQGRINAFVMSAGTGGSIAGVSRYLKEKDKSIQVILADPTGSSLHNRVKYGICYTTQQQERTLKKHRYDSIVEGVGLDRITTNFEYAIIDDSEHIQDQELVDMAHWIYRHEGLFIGSSSALNLVTTCKVAKKMKENSVIVTIICDSGMRHLSRFWNRNYIETCKLNGSQLIWPEENCIPECLRDIIIR